MEASKLADLGVEDSGVEAWETKATTKSMNKSIDVLEALGLGSTDGETEAWEKKVEARSNEGSYA